MWKSRRFVLNLDRSMICKMVNKTGIDRRIRRTNSSNDPMVTAKIPANISNSFQKVMAD